MVKHHKNTAGRETSNLKSACHPSISAPCPASRSKGDYVKVGQKIGDTEAFVSAPIHSSVSGTVTDITSVRSSMGGMETHIVIETDKKRKSVKVQIPH